jgi:hypothetical protein
VYPKGRATVQLISEISLFMVSTALRLKVQSTPLKSEISLLTLPNSGSENATFMAGPNFNYRIPGLNFNCRIPCVVFTTVSDAFPCLLLYKEYDGESAFSVIFKGGSGI